MNFARSSSLFSPRVFENSDFRTKFNSSLGMKNDDEMYGFSSVKVKLVDSCKTKQMSCVHDE